MNSGLAFGIGAFSASIFGILSYTTDLWGFVVGALLGSAVTIISEMIQGRIINQEGSSE